MIFRRKKAAPKIICCEKCPEWGMCKTKWYRGERGEEQLCCKDCPDYKSCINA